jgi:hypothetical protein
MAPYLALREIQRTFKAGEPNEGLVASPTYTLQDVKLAPEFRRVFETELGLAKWTGSPTPRLEFTPEGVRKLTGQDGTITIRFGYATKPESLESATYKWAIGDEFGQPDVKNGSIDAILRRLSIYGGRLIMLTTPYILGWLKTRFHDKAIAGEKGYGLVRFESQMNPSFPQEEWERAKKELPKWKFDLFYRAIFTRPAGAIYESFDPDIHCIDEMPEGWERWQRCIGIDFGPVNTAAVFLAVEPKTLGLYCYRSYHTGGRTPAQHIEAFLSKDPAYESPDDNRPTYFAVGGAPSEDEWRERFATAGLPIARPKISDVETGIDAVHAAIRKGRLKFYRPALAKLIEDLLSYSWETDENQEPIPHKIADKHSYHRPDALRYIVSEMEDFRPVKQSSRIVKRSNYRVSQ